MYISRTELFELVWSQPRTTLAKELKISDVAIAKRCRSANIPMPPAGYWARLEAGKLVTRPALPLRLPGGSELVALAEPRYAAPATLPVAAAPPSYTHDVHSLVQAAVLAIGRVRAQRDLSDPHSALTPILKKESERRRKFSETKWSIDTPKFDNPTSQRELRLYSAIFRAFSNLGVKGSLSEDEEWKSGVGTTYSLSGGISFGAAWVALRFIKAEGKSATAVLKLLVGSTTESTAHSVWMDKAENPLERQLEPIARAILVCAEEHMRADAQQRYEWRIQEQERRRQAEEAQRQKEQERQAAQRARDEALRREALYGLALRRQRCLDIRSLVQDLRLRRPDLQGDPQFVAWCEFALTEAQRIDPIAAPLSELLEVTAAAVPET